MYTWKIKVILNSGKELTMYYTGEENNSNDIVKKVVNGGDNTFNGFLSEDKKANILVKVSQIAAMEISAG